MPGAGLEEAKAGSRGNFRVQFVCGTKEARLWGNNSFERRRAAVESQRQTSSSPASLAEKKRKNGLKASPRRTDGRSGWWLRGRMDNLKVFYISTQKTTGKKLERRPDPKDAHDPEISTEEQRNLEAAATEQSSCRGGDGWARTTHGWPRFSSFYWVSSNPCGVRLHYTT